MPSVVLKAEGLTKRYGPVTAVRALSLEVHEGEVLGLLGPNGAGKTTSVKMITGLLRPDAGRVALHGRPIASDPQTRARVGVCPQETVLWERLTCLEQLQFVGEMYGVAGPEAWRRGGRLLDAFGLAEKRHAQARTLSGGMRRRLNLAMALVHEPDLIVLDEPEAGLDPQSRVMVREFVKALARKKAVILTTHNMDEADRVADRVAILDHGALLVLDTPEALKRRAGSGDVVEIAVEGDGGRAQGALAGLAGGPTVQVGPGAVMVRAPNAVGMLPAILQTLVAAGLEPGEVRVRQASLEDVFIQLTGRRLRE